MLIKIASLRRPHGVKGGMLMTASQEGSFTTLHKGQLVWIYPVDCNLEEAERKNPSKGKAYTISEVGRGVKRILYLETIVDRNQVEALLPFDLYAMREDFPELEDPNEFYCIDLIGLDVYDHLQKHQVGRVVKTYSNGAQEIVVITTLEGEEIELPFINSFFPVISIEEKRVEVSLPEWI